MTLSFFLRVITSRSRLSQTSGMDSPMYGWFSAVDINSSFSFLTPWKDHFNIKMTYFKQELSPVQKYFGNGKVLEKYFKIFRTFDILPNFLKSLTTINRVYKRQALCDQEKCKPTVYEINLRPMIQKYKWIIIRSSVYKKNQNLFLHFAIFLFVLRYFSSKEDHHTDFTR